MSDDGKEVCIIPVKHLPPLTQRPAQRRDLCLTLLPVFLIPHAFLSTYLHTYIQEDVVIWVTSDRVMGRGQQLREDGWRVGDQMCEKELNG